MHEIITPVPSGAPKPPQKFHGKPIQEYYKYHDGNGRFLGASFLVNNKIFPLTYRSDGNGSGEWDFKSFDKPRPIFGLDTLEKFPESTVLIVPNEQMKTLLGKLLDSPKLCVISWIGGEKTIKTINWEPIYGKKVVFYANSKTYDSVRMHFNFLKKSILKAFLLRTDVDLISLKRMDLIGNIKKNIIEFPDNREKIQSDEFQCLGYNVYEGRLMMYYLPKGSKKVICLSASQHTKGNLISLAPLQYFEREYPSKSGPNYTVVANDLIRRCEVIGIYDPEKIRGLGAWYDSGRSVLHLGNFLIINGEKRDISEAESNYIYESEIPISDDFDMSESLSKSEAHKLIKICDILPWSEKIFSQLFAGQLFLSSICGALEWRSNTWLTGESGSGKSWTLDNIVEPIVERFCVNAVHNSTEAGLRQVLGNSARFVKIDEFESKDFQDIQRMQKIIELARVSSSNRGDGIIKGTTGGKAMTYCPRSMFLFSSVVPILTQQADRSRITLLKLVKRDDEKKFNELNSIVVKTLTKEWCQQFRARAFKNIPVIRENIAVFREVMSHVLNSRRAGDQIGTLLGGCYCIHNDGEASGEDVKHYIEDFDFNFEVVVESDQERCINLVTEQLIPTSSGNKEAVGKLIRLVVNRLEGDSESIVKSNSSKDYLKKYGINCMKNKGKWEVCFSCNHAKLSELLKETAWASDYRHVLGRFGGAHEKSVRFASKTSNAVCIPYDNIFSEDEDEKEESVF